MGEDEGKCAIRENAVCRVRPLTIVGIFEGTVPEDKHHEVRVPAPLRNQGRAELVGDMVVAIVYDNDARANYDPKAATRRGARNGKFASDVLGVDRPGWLRESGSSGILHKGNCVSSRPWTTPLSGESKSPDQTGGCLIIADTDQWGVPTRDRATPLALQLTTVRRAADWRGTAAVS